MHKFKLVIALACCLTLITACGDDDNDGAFSGDPVAESAKDSAPNQAESDAQQAADEAAAEEDEADAEAGDDASANDPSSDDHVIRERLPQKVKEAEYFELATDYEGVGLTLRKDHPQSRGEIKISGNDAKTLYASLLAQPAVSESESEEWLPAMVKKGYDVSCYEQAKAATPELFEYTCMLFINYRSGNIVPQASSVLWQEGKEPQQRPYHGKNLMVKMEEGLPMGRIRLLADDAHMLLLALYKPTHFGFSGGVESYRKKMGQDYVCTAYSKGQAPAGTNSNYVCDVYVDITTGEVVPVGPGQ